MRRAPLAIARADARGWGTLALSLLAHGAVALALLGLAGGGGVPAPAGQDDGQVVTVSFVSIAADGRTGTAAEPASAPFAEPDAPLLPDFPVSSVEPLPQIPVPDPSLPTGPAAGIAEPIVAMPEPEAPFLAPAAAAPPPPAPSPVPRAAAPQRPASLARDQPTHEAARSPAAAASGSSGQASPAPRAPAGSGGGTQGGEASPIPILVTNPGFRHPPRPPVYPRAAVSRGLEGTVLIHALVSPSGETLEVRVDRSSGVAMLDRAAVEAVRGWAFRPATVGGRAVPAWVEVPVNFRLS